MRKQITLPSGAVCTVTKFSVRDLMEFRDLPGAFPAEDEKRKEAIRQAIETKPEVTARIFTIALTRCCSPLTFPNGARRRIVEDKDLDQLRDDEITVAELENDDAIAIVTEVSKLSNMTKEAGRKAQTFPAQPQVAPPPPSDGAEVRSAAQPDPGAGH
ncbi:MAG: hypothetical protein AB1705_14555 [Verrucomicrobiota bacterium]